MVQFKCLKKHQCTETVNFTGFNNHDLNPHIYLHFDLWKQTKESFHLAEHQRIYRLICEGPVFWSGSESEMLHSYMMFTVLLVLGDLGWSAIWLEQKPPVLILIPDSALCGQSPSVLNQRGQETWLHAPQEEDQEAPQTRRRPETGRRPETRKQPDKSKLSVCVTWLRCLLQHNHTLLLLTSKPSSDFKSFWGGKVQLLSVHESDLQGAARRSYPDALTWFPWS